MKSTLKSVDFDEATDKDRLAPFCGPRCRLHLQRKVDATWLGKQACTGIFRWHDAMAPGRIISRESDRFIFNIVLLIVFIYPAALVVAILNKRIIITKVTF